MKTSLNRLLVVKRFENALKIPDFFWNKNVFVICWELLLCFSLGILDPLRLERVLERYKVLARRASGLSGCHLGIAGDSKS